MRELLYESGMGVGLALFSSAALATQEEVVAAVISKGPIYVFILFMIIVIVAVYSMRSRDRRMTTVDKIFTGRKAIQSVGPDTPVTECVRIMAAEKIGALLVMDGRKLTGIFTERDALNKVLAASLDVSRAKVSEVMTKDPYCIPPTMTVRDAMELVTRRRFRHLPIVENGMVLALVSSGDLTDWLLKNPFGESYGLVDFAARS